MAEDPDQVVRAAKELLGQDRLSELAQKSHRNALGELPDKLRGLDSQLEEELAQYRSSMASGGAGLGGSGQPGGPAAKGVPQLPKASPWLQTLKDRVERRGEGSAGQQHEGDEEEEVVVPLREGQSFLSESARDRMSRIEQQTDDALHPPAYEEEDGSLWFGRGGSGRPFDHRPFAELCSLTTAARESAAPFVRGVYEDVFMRSGALGELEGAEGQGVRVVLQGREPWCELVREAGGGLGWVEGRVHLENGLAADIAHALRLDPVRVRVLSLPLKGTSAEVHILADPLLQRNDEEDEEDPTAGSRRHQAPPDGSPTPLVLARELCAQARRPASQLRRMRHGSALVGGEVRALAPAEKKEQQKYEFSILRGGIVPVGEPEPTPTPSVARVPSSARGGEGGGGDQPEGRPYPPSGKQYHAITVSRKGLDEEHGEAYAVKGTLRSARRDEDGFWMDNGRQMGKSPFGGVYGTLEPSTKANSGAGGEGWGLRMPWVWGGLASVFMVLVTLSVYGKVP